MVATAPWQRAAVVALALLLACTPVLAQSRSSLHDLAFMSGCWTGPDANGATIEEHYTTPSNNLILGTTRYLRDGLAQLRDELADLLDG